MPHIIGLLDNTIPTEAIRQHVSNMARRTANHASQLQVSPIAAQGHCAVACVQRVPNQAYVDDELICTICGEPWWSEPTLQELQQNAGPARALGAAFRRHGKDLLKKLHGRFALAVVEPATDRALLAIDRLGLQALAWYPLNDGLAFSTRVDALTEHPDIDKRPDHQAIYDYFYFSMVPSPRSIVSGCRKLLPGQYLEYEKGKADVGFYWRIPYSETSHRSARELGRELEAILQRVIQRDLGDGAIGAFLSGGLDSSTVTGYFARASQTPIDVYGIGFDAEGFDEMAYARATAKHFGVRLHEYYVTPTDVAAALPRIAAAYDEPFGNESAIPAYYCAKLAADDGKTTLLAGDGGDEIFAGNARYANQKVFALYERLPPFLRKNLLEPAVSAIPRVGDLPLIGKVSRYINYANMPMPDRLDNYNFLHRSPPADIFTADFLAGVDPMEPLANSREVYLRCGDATMLKKMLHMDLKITLADNDLRKVNRTSEIAGIDVRYPMLDEELVEFSAGIPSNMLLPGSKLRHFYRESLKHFLAPETLSKRKHGFGLPFGLWLRKDEALSAMASERFEAFRKREIFNPAYLDFLMKMHGSEHASYYGVMIWRVMMLEEWLDAHGH